MSCNHAIELLPWFLNGSLAPAERAELAAHLASCERCREERAHTESAGEIFAQHLSVQTLVDHGFGRATPELPIATIEEHLAICPRCAAELELVRETAWRARGEGADVLPFVPRARPPRPAPAWRWAALAAGLALVMGGFGGWLAVEQMRTTWREREAALVADLDRATAESTRLATENERERREIAQLGAKVAALEAPQPNLEVIDLFPGATVQRGEPRPADDEMHRNDALLGLVLHTQAPSYPGYELEITTAAGARLELVEGLVRQDDDAFTISLRTAGLPDAVTLRLFGRRGDERREIARYELAVRPTEHDAKQ